MIDDELSELPKSALRDYDGDARLERVWQRLDANLGRAPSRSRAGLLVAPALGVLLFAAGVVVGRLVPPEAPPEPEVAAEPAPVSEPRPSRVEPALGRGERPRAPPPPNRPRSVSARAPSPSAIEPGEGIESAIEVPAYVTPYVPPPPPGPPEWQRLADAGDFPAAWSALERTGGFDLAIATASPEELMALVDVARAAGGREYAVRALRRLVETFPGAPEAPLAAWTLGNLLEQSGEVGGAADAYALYRRLSPAGDFAEDAAARQVDVALSQQDVELAARLVAQYAKDFPNGRRLAEFKDELAKLEADRADAGIAPAPEALPQAPEPLRDEAPK